TSIEEMNLNAFASHNSYGLDLLYLVVFTDSTPVECLIRGRVGHFGRIVLLDAGQVGRYLTVFEFSTLDINPILQLRDCNKLL
ncbi:Hypothetical predicted protein, partial [Olea europaea subsp. europaea]